MSITSMKPLFDIEITTSRGHQAVFRGLALEKDQRSSGDIALALSGGSPCRVTATCADTSQAIRQISYRLSVPLRNFHEVIIPDTGRAYSARTQPVSFWASKHLSCVNNVRVPLFIFTGMDLNMALAFGVIGENIETEFTCLEPTTNRALIAWMKRLTLEIKRGPGDFPIPRSVMEKSGDNSIAEYLFFSDAARAPRQSWILTLREFARSQQDLLQLNGHRTAPAALEPVWCSWTDWNSNDVTHRVIIENVRHGIELGIRNYIIDDGWFGPGLDNDFDVELNIGDWNPDPNKIPDMNRLVGEMKEHGARALIWCAPHAVAPGADCFKERMPYLIRNRDGSLVMTPNKFHALCFMCPEAREIMAEICASFITRWDVDGAKYDLFNCVPELPCASRDHAHDTDSMIAGLTKTLELIDRKCRGHKPDYLVELKQNYGTVFLAPYGTMMRAGDTPYCPQGNFLRTAYIQAYTPYALNDYQTITRDDPPEDAACMIIKMLSVGIPAYSIDLTALNGDNKRVIAYYNKWYRDRIADFMKFRVPMDGALSTWKLETPSTDIFFLLNNATQVTCPGTKAVTILNGTFSEEIVARFTHPRQGAEARISDCFGRMVDVQRLGEEKLFIRNIPRGGMCTIATS